MKTIKVSTRTAHHGIGKAPKMNLMF